MLSPESIQFLKDHNFSVALSRYTVTITNKDSIRWVWPIISILMGLIFIPLVAIGNYKMAILVIVLLIYPVYQLIRDLRQPKIVQLDKALRTLFIETKWGRNESYSFNQIEKLGLSTFDQHNDANAFRDDIVTRYYYLDVVFDNDKTKTLFMFKEGDEKLIDKMLDELRYLIETPSLG